MSDSTQLDDTPDQLFFVSYTEKWVQNVIKVSYRSNNFNYERPKMWPRFLVPQERILQASGKNLTFQTITTPEYSHNAEIYFIKKLTNFRRTEEFRRTRLQVAFRYINTF